MKGRKPLPRALHVLRGNPSKLTRAQLADPPTAGPLDVTAPPAWLSKPARAEWTRVASLLAPLGMATETDAAALAAYCEAWQTWRAATRKLRAKGLVVRGSTGSPVVSPYVKIADQALTHLRAFLVEFGMTPSARARVKVPPAAPATASKWGGLV